MENVVLVSHLDVAVSLLIPFLKFRTRGKTNEEKGGEKAYRFLPLV